MTRISISCAEEHPVSDIELEVLLKRVYVGEGHTAPELGASALGAAQVRSRGKLLCARLQPNWELVGTVIVVVPSSVARRFAGEDECELHLLATAPEQRGKGIGRALVEAALAEGREQGYRRMLLWTQPAMLAAQHLYRASGFERVEARDFERDGRQFLFFAREL